MDATKPYKFIGFGAMDATKPYNFIGFGAMDATKPYKFIGFGVDLPTGGPRNGPPVGRSLRAAGSAGTPNIDEVRSAQKPCINQGLRDPIALWGPIALLMP